MAGPFSNLEDRFKELEDDGRRPGGNPPTAPPTEQTAFIEIKPLPVYGDGQNIRDWLYVEDHVEALYKVVMEGDIGEIYNIGGHNEKKNIEVVKTICEILDEEMPLKLINNNLDKIEKFEKQNSIKTIQSYQDLITFVKDRPGHDLRYAIDASKIKNNLNWTPIESFKTGLKKTIKSKALKSILIEINPNFKEHQECVKILAKEFSNYKKINIIKNSNIYNIVFSRI